MTSAHQARLWRAGGFVDDEWTLLADADPDDGAVPIESSAPVIVPLARFAARSDAFVRRSGPLGLQVPAGVDIAPALPFLKRIKLIALEFLNFADGRNYSTARLLRERHGYGGELRAVGDVLADQIPLMQRCGIDAFQITNQPTVVALEAGRIAAMHRYYQPVGGSDRPAGSRPWARTSA